MKMTGFARSPLKQKLVSLQMNYIILVNHYGIKSKKILGCSLYSDCICLFVLLVFSLYYLSSKACICDAINNYDVQCYMALFVKAKKNAVGERADRN